MLFKRTLSKSVICVSLVLKSSENKRTPLISSNAEVSAVSVRTLSAAMAWNPADTAKARSSDAKKRSGFKVIHPFKRILQNIEKQNSLLHANSIAFYERIVKYRRLKRRNAQKFARFPAILELIWKIKLSAAIMLSSHFTKTFSAFHAHCRTPSAVDDTKKQRPG